MHSLAHQHFKKPEVKIFRYIRFIFLISFICNPVLYTFADTNYRIRGFTSVSENGQYKEGDKVADEMTTSLASYSLVLGWLGIGKSELETRILMDETELNLNSQWSDLIILFELTEKTSLSFGSGIIEKGKASTEYYNKEYQTEKVSGKSWFSAIGFDYKPLFVSNIPLFKKLEFMFGVRENLIEYKDFSADNNLIDSSVIKINSLQFVVGIGIVL